MWDYFHSCRRLCSAWACTAACSNTW